MATDNDTKLTRYTSAVTIVTADTMNKIYGGEFGYNETVDEFDPLVFGHVHDGKHEDGHASKILLTSGAHIRGYLGNANLGGTDGTTPAVRYSNILCYSDAVYGSPAARRAAAAAGGFDLEILAIPEYTEDPVTGERCYYLDLSNSAGGIDGSIQFNEAGAFSGNQDLFYDYTNERFGLGTNTPERKAHIVDNSNPPLRIEGIGAGSGTVLVVDGNGDIYSDASIGPDQNLFDSVALNNAGGGTQTGDATITADTTTDTLTLSAGTNITLDGNAGGDTITISSTGGTPGGSYRSIQFHDNLVPAGFAGDDALTYNDVPGGTGASGPILRIKNTTGSDNNLDRRAEIRFGGVDSGSADQLTSSIVARHLTYGAGPATGVVHGINAGSMILRTNNPNTGLERAVLISSHSIFDDRAHVGIGAVDYSDPPTPGGFTTPARRLHIKELSIEDDPPQGYSPLRINDLKNGVGQLMVWDRGLGDSWPQTGSPPYHEGDVYYVPNGDENDILKINGDGYPEWGPAAGANSFDQINLDNAGLTGSKSEGVITGDTVPAAQAAGSETLTIFAGNNILLKGNLGTDSIVISAPNRVYSQWLSAGDWVPKNGIVGRAPKYTLLNTPNRDIAYKYVIDNTTNDSCVFYATVSLPVDGQLSGGVGTSTDGSQQSALPDAASANDRYKDSVPLFATKTTTNSDTPSSCRITAYFIIQGGNQDGEIVNLRVTASYGNSGTNYVIQSVSDGELLQGISWNAAVDNDVPNSGDLSNLHSYNSPPLASGLPDGTVMVSDFSPLKIDVGEPSDGFATFRLTVTDFPADPPGNSYFDGLSLETRASTIRLVGTRILWIWE